MTATVFPLCWPDTMPRAKAREPGAFKTTLTGALENVATSLRLFARDSGVAVTGVVLSSNVSLGVNTPEDPGVAAWFTWDGAQVCIPVDRYRTPAANLQAIHHVIEARRTELRHGTLALVRATFRGFQALPAPEPWTVVLALPLEASAAQIQTAYRQLAKSAHPDAGGSADALSRLTRARDAALVAARAA